MQEAYIIAAYRSAVGKAPKGVFRIARADDLAAEVIKYMLAKIPNLDPQTIDDVIVGCATPEGAQGLNLGRMVSLLALSTDKVPGLTVNRYCASGLETIALAVAKIRSGMAHCIVAGGAEVMSTTPFGGLNFAPNPQIANQNPDYYWGMGLTAEAVAQEYHISRNAQDVFALLSHQKAIKAIDNGYFDSQIVPITLNQTFLNNNMQTLHKNYTVTTDEGPRRDTNLQALANLKPVFAKNGTVTAGNSSQTSDGAAFVLIVSESKLKELNVAPIARLVGYSVAGVAPRVMGIGPVEAIPKVVKASGINLNKIDLIELNEAFGAQALAVINTLNLNPAITNVNGGAIALGHPLGCTGAKLTVQILAELQRRKQKYGLVTMCVGTGQGAAGLFEMM